ncbi:TonB-linked SusC/RagA family outer membrane protein [Algoriphagus iocasae]|uniref:TonB-linked SusC/RagA family outer membrane protein n=1 Tax=Algoriphagus iocasae TaxID=1836499 RepID=A0A841MCQ7_9BACT|nr:SusC/RagA family TonB-linked outer membrane protein [Algoriphagus iocasae]MBB6324503.1 TonB-linked SusC/RagA family outer membrane protein [Algoriphagus iocasae]
MRWTVLLTGLILTTAFSLHAASVNGQSLDTKVTLTLKDASLKEALDELSEKSKVPFNYGSKVASSTERISYTANLVPLRMILNEVLADLPFEYIPVGDEVVIRYHPRPSTALKGEPVTEQAPKEMVKGIILGHEGLPMPGATIIIRGTTRGTAADENGEFQLSDVKEGDILVISMIGFRTREIEITDPDQSLTIELEEAISDLEGVTVSTGYETMPIERATGSFAHVDNNLYNRQVSTDVISRLKAIAPSVQFDERSGEMKLTIRGRSTIFANDQPLIILDNFPFEGDLNAINPNDIEDISILRDAAAASIWGVRAGNGVIVITTKSGSRDKEPTVTFNSNFTVGEKPDLFYQPKMNSSDFIEAEKYLFNQSYYDSDLNNTQTYPYVSPVVDILAMQRNGELSAEQANAQINTYRNQDIRGDFMDHFYRKSTRQQYAVNLQGGNKVHQYYFSAGYDNNKANLVTDSYERYTLKTDQTFIPLKGLEVKAGIQYSQSQQKSDNFLPQVIENIDYPYARLQDENGEPAIVNRDYRRSFVDQAGSQGLLDWYYRPVNEPGLNLSSSVLRNLRANVAISYDVSQHLKVSAQYQNQQQTTNSETLRDQASYYMRNMINEFSEVSEDGVDRIIPLGDLVHLNTSELRSNNGRIQLNYNWFSENHYVTALAGFEARQTNTNGFGNNLYGYDPNLGTSINVDFSSSYRRYPTGYFASIPSNNSVGGTTDRFRSYFINGAYSYKDRYTLSASGRIDQSNLFGVRANQRSVPLWSTGFKWDIHKENFLSADRINQLTFRTSYGYSGNIDNSITAFTTMATTSGNYTNRPALRLINPPNPDLKWEKIAIANFGIDFSVFQNRITGSIEYYRKKGDEIIGEIPADPTTGVGSFRGNIAGIKGSGWDINVSSQNVQGKFSWQTNFMFNVAKDQVTEYLVDPGTFYLFLNASINRYPSQASPIVGKPLYSIYSYPWKGLDPETGDPVGIIENVESTDYRALSNYYSDNVDQLIYNGPALPTTFGALRNTFGYKNFSLSLNISYHFGGYFRRSSISYNDFFRSGYYYAHKDFTDQWREPGDELFTSIPSMVYPSNGSRDSFYASSDILVEKSDLLRLQDINFSYDFPFASQIGFSALNMYFYANNLGLLWTANDYDIDPDYPELPLPKSYAIGIKATF